MILTSFLLASAGLHVGILGEGRLRFAAGHTVAFASAANLTVDAKGLLGDTKGRPVLPQVHLGHSNFSVSMNGTVTVSGRKVGRLVLQRPNGEIGFPGEGGFGVVELGPKVPIAFPFVGGGVMQGNLYRTDDPLNLAIQGNGFFKVLQPDGVPAYTRNGDFRLNAKGKVVTRDGLPLDPQVSLPIGASAISVSAQGDVYAIPAGRQAASMMGRIELTTFMNPSGLRRLGHGRFAQTDDSGDEVSGIPGENGTGTLIGGYLEILPVTPNSKESHKR